MSARRKARRCEHRKQDVRRVLKYCDATGKICYSKQQAKQAARELFVADGDGELRVYRCEECGRHHIGHLPESFREKPR
ncbi:MAG: hypothetical protein KDA80_21295 [Planctomycetaceae bacterium]|nr:hypothetical protein [Planctomycetaceae bacterium]